MIICLVNSQKFENSKGYVGHFVVVKGYNEKSLIIHDLGLPALENRIVYNDIFEKAWADPTKDTKNMIAIKL